MQHLMRSSCRPRSRLVGGSGSNHQVCGAPTSGGPWTRRLDACETMVLHTTLFNNDSGHKLWGHAAVAVADLDSVASFT